MTTIGPASDERELEVPPHAARLLARLPAEGRVLVLEAGDVLGPLLDRSGAEKRSVARGRIGDASVLEPGSWDAIVVAVDIDVEVGSWQPLVTRLRGALAHRGRLHLVLDAGPDESSSAARSDAVGALFESGYCVLREESVTSVSVGAPAVAAPSRRGGGAGDGTTTTTNETGTIQARAVRPIAGAPSLVALIEARADAHRVRSYRRGDEEAIQRLFDVSFSPPRAPEHWRWKYRDNPFGAHAISCAFTQEGELAAHYAAYPVPFRRSRPGGGQTILCHQVGDTMTDRRFRDVGRGPTSLLARTARHFYARHCEGRVAFNYGFNTGNIQRFSQLFVGARKVWDIELWRARAARLGLTRPRRFRPYRSSTVDRLDREFDDFFERVAARYGLLVERRRPWIEWRYLRCPDRAMHLVRVDRGRRLVGWGVFRLEGERVLWGDALVDPAHPEAVSAMLRHALALPAARATAGGERRVEGWFSRHPTWWIDLLSALGFESVTEPQNLGMVYVPFREDPGEELATRFYLAMGDGDLF